MKNAFLKLLCKILPIPKHKESKRFLLVSTTALGDTLWATPTIFSLRKSFPDSHIAVLTSTIGNEVLKTNPYIDKIYLLKKPLLLWRKLYKERFCTILILHTSQRIALPLCSLLGATHIIGTRGINKGLDSLLTITLEPAYEHEILRRLRMVERVGGKIHTEMLQFFPEEKSCPLPQGKWVAIHPGSKDGFKRWPARNFIKVGKELQAKGYRIFLSGTEKELIEEIRSQIPDSIYFQGLDLHAFADKLSQVELLISNDTGPVHLALALGIPLIALYGATDSRLCGPHLAKKAVALQAPPTCFPCIKRRCRTPFCLLQIDPNRVLSVSYQLLHS